MWHRFLVWLGVRKSQQIELLHADVILPVMEAAKPTRNEDSGVRLAKPPLSRRFQYDSPTPRAYASVQRPETMPEDMLMGAALYSLVTSRDDSRPAEEYSCNREYESGGGGDFGGAGAGGSWDSGRDSSDYSSSSSGDSSSGDSGSSSSSD